MHVWNVTPAAYLLDPIERAEKSGFDLDKMLTDIGVSRDHFLQPGATLTRDQYYRIIEHLVLELGVDDVGFVQPENEHLLNVGTAGLTAMTAATVGGSLRVVIRFQHLLAVPTRLRLESRHHDVHLVFDSLERHDMRDWLLRWSVETSASSFAVFLKAYPLQLSSARFVYPQPGNVRAYDATFGCELRFDQNRNELVFPEAVLDQPLPTANPLVHEVALRQCEQTDRLSRPNAELVERIQSILLTDATYPVQLHDVASRLGMSARTLQRRLREQGASFRRVAVQTRCRLAQELLRTDLTINEVAYLTGYSDVANFSAAFKGEVGVPPSRFQGDIQNRRTESD